MVSAPKSIWGPSQEDFFVCLALKTNRSPSLEDFTGYLATRKTIRRPPRGDIIGFLAPKTIRRPPKEDFTGCLALKTNRRPSHEDFTGNLATPKPDLRFSNTANAFNLSLRQCLSP